MPVPVPAATPAPRRLLRDVVFDKMLAAIGDGTLELGERLNDDELVTWLGVSRTPVREAIAKLADYGLVDIEANRYTRVINPTIDEFADTTRTAFGVWGLVAARGIPLLTDAQAKTFATTLAKVGRAADGTLKQGSIAGFAAALDILVEASGSTSLARLVQTVSDRAVLLFGLASEKVTFSVAAALVPALTDAGAARDGEAGFRAFREAIAGMGDYVGKVGEAGIFLPSAQ
ncbi:GntR family transcriptional regulator [Frondihabitans cladoniiphilus]|uniref:GntR family transcriptional regulator n=1 Tax=Frondihabitans cladoniiphilus TaxID=715785 RepID=A0ABP8W0Y8_9MICO